MCSTSCADTQHDVTTLEVDKMIENINIEYLKYGT